MLTRRSLVVAIIPIFLSSLAAAKDKSTVVASTTGGGTSYALVCSCGIPCVETRSFSNYSRDRLPARLLFVSGLSASSNDSFRAFPGDCKAHRCKDEAVVA